MVRVISSVAALAMLFQAQAAPAAKASSVVVDSAPQVVEEQQHAPSTTPTVVVLTPPPTPAVAQTTPTVAATTVAATTTSAPTRRVESTVAPSSSTPAPEEPKRAPSNDAGVQAAAAAAPKETPRAAASSASDALVTFEGVKSVAYQTAYYWIDVAKYCRDTAVSMLPKDMQGKYNQAVRDGKKYYAQAKDVYYAEVAPKIDPVIDAGTVGVSEVYSFVNEKQKTITAAPFKKMHAAYPATRGIAGSELADRVVFIVLSLSLLSWAVFLFKLPFRCLGYLLCPRRAKGVRSSAPSQSEKAKAQSSNKGSSPTPTKNFKGRKQN